MIDGTTGLTIKSTPFYNIVYLSLADETWLNLKRSLGIYGAPARFWPCRAGYGSYNPCRDLTLAIGKKSIVPCTLRASRILGINGFTDKSVENELPRDAGGGLHVYSKRFRLCDATPLEIDGVIVTRKSQPTNIRATVRKVITMMQLLCL